MYSWPMRVDVEMVLFDEEVLKLKEEESSSWYNHLHSSRPTI